MRKSKFIPMLLIPAAFAACTNEDVLDSYAGNEIAKDVVEDVVFKVSFDGQADSRGAYAGETDENGKVDLFANFYLEAEFADNNDATTPLLTDNDSFAGDMMGFCLTNGGNAITNMPFYVAGYGSTKATTPADAKTTIFPFVTHAEDGKILASANSLYTLNLDKTLYTAADVFTQADYKASVTAVAAKEDLAADELDVTKAIVRNNAGVMTGDYIAYYPYNPNFTEPGGVPVKELKDLYVHTVAVSADTKAEALEEYTATSFKKNLFAISQTTNHVNGATKSGDVSLKPLTSVALFKIINTDEGVGANYKNKGVQIKRITVSAAENSEKTDFALDGTVALNDLNKIVATESSAIVGVQFLSFTVDNTYKENADFTEVGDRKYIAMPFYPVSGKKIQIDVYTTDGRVASTVKQTAPELGKAYIWTLDLGKLDFVATTRKIFTADDYIAEKATAGNLMLMRDIEVEADASSSVALNIEGDYKLTLKQGTISKNITFAEGTTVELQGAVLGSDAVLKAEKAIFNYTSETTIANHIEVEELTIPANSSVVLNDAEVTTVINNGTLRVRDAAEKTVEFTTLNNNKIFAVGTGYAATIGTLNNNAGATFAMSGEITATVINNAAGIPATLSTPAVPAAIINVYGGYADTDILGETTVNNAGTINWAAAAELDMTVNNSGSFTISGVCDFSGAFTNTGDLNVTGKVEGISGSVTNSTDGYMNVTGYFGFTTTKLNINAGIVEDNGTINGNTNVTVAEGAEFIGNAVDNNTLVSALSSFNINGKYTGINVTGNVEWPQTVASTDKKIYQKADITFAKATALNGGLIVAQSAQVTAQAGLTISEVAINSGETWTIAAKSNVTVNGIITNNGVYSQHNTAVVWCNGIAGTGDWGTLKPRY